jgi:hypothetical protein
MKMLGTNALQQARRRHLVLANGTGYFKGEYMLTPVEAGKPSPHAFLVEQDPHTTILTHFHLQNQFQVIIGGSGTLGRHEVGPLLVHYAGAYTGYGPIVCGPQGIQYLTLRAHHDPGANFMPEAREQLLRGPKSHYSSEPIERLSAEALLALDAVGCEELLPLEEGGLAVMHYRLPPGGQSAGLAPATGAGQYRVVVSGSLVHDGYTLSSPESVFLSSDETNSVMIAGAQGAEVLLLQFPPLAELYRPQS